MSDIFSAIVYGVAGTQGSKTPFVNSTTGKAGVRESSANSRDWRQSLIKDALNDQPDKLLDEAVIIWMRVYVSRPASHYDKNGNLKRSAPKFPKAGRDLDKVQRAVGDGLKTAKWFVNDARIAGWDVMRLYIEDRLEPERVEIKMWSLEENGPDFLKEVMSHVITDGHPIADHLVPK